LGADVRRGYIDPSLPRRGKTRHGGGSSPNTLFLGLGSPRPRTGRTDRELERRHPPLLKRVVLPALTASYLKDDSEYLEDTVGRIDAPLLSNLTTTLFNQLIFVTPRLCNFIGHTETYEAPHQGSVRREHSVASTYLTPGQPKITNTNKKNCQT